MLENVFNRYDEVVVGGMGEGFNVLNAKLGYMLEKELEARGKVNDKLNIEGEKDVRNGEKGNVDYDQYIKRKYSFYDKIKGVVSINAFPGENLLN